MPRPRRLGNGNNLLGQHEVPGDAAGIWPAEGDLDRARQRSRRGRLDSRGGRQAAGRSVEHRRQIRERKAGRHRQREGAANRT